MFPRRWVPAWKFRFGRAGVLNFDLFSRAPHMRLGMSDAPLCSGNGGETFGRNIIPAVFTFTGHFSNYSLLALALLRRHQRLWG